MPIKRLLAAAGLILVAIGLAIGIYFIFFRSDVAPPTTTPPVVITNGGLPTVPTGPPTNIPTVPPSTLPVAPTIAQGGPTSTTQITNEPVLAATLTSDGKTMAYYNRTDNRFYRLGADGTVSKITDKQFFDVQNITWAPGANRAILEYPDNSNILYDFNQDKQVTLPKHWEDFSFSPDGEKIATKSLGIDSSNRWLVTSNADGSEAKALEPLGDNADKVILSWSPTNETVAFSKTGDAQGFDTSEIFLIGQNHENLKSLIVEGRDFRPLWTNSGDSLLYSVYSSSNNYLPTLWISDAHGDSIGDNRHSVGLNTWADKCSAASATVVYCAVPTSLPEGAGFAPKVAQSIPDQIFRVDTQSGTKTLIGSPAEGASISQLSVSSDEKYLYYTDAQSGLLRKMQLK